MTFWFGMAALGYGEAILGALLLGCAIWLIARQHRRVRKACEQPYEER